MSRSRLQNSLDRDVFQIVRRYADEATDLPASRIRPSAIYDWIKTSNSSLRRRPKKQLEDSIERVLAVLQEDECGNDDELVPLEGNVGEELEVEKPSVDIMNRQIVNGWATAAKSGAATPSTNGQKTRKRDATRATEERESKKQKTLDLVPPTHVSLKDVGGCEQVIEQLREHLVLPLLDPEEYVRRRLPIPRGILLHGPPGCGKTLICRAYAALVGVPFVEILGPSIVSGVSGESEKQIREIFEKAKEAAPCLLFIDEIDVIAPKRESAQSQMEKRIVAQLLVSMDGLAMEANDGKPVIVLAATNRPDSLDPALRRGGRFDTEINMGVPNESTREKILQALTRGPKMAPDVDLKALAKATAGFVGADLKDLVSKAGTWSMDRYRRALEEQAAELESEMEVDGDQSEFPNESVRRSYLLVKRLRAKGIPRPDGHDDAISMEAFQAVLPTITPSSKREGFATVPDTTWEDVGALDDVREELELMIVEPIKDPERFRNLGLPPSDGVLLWGPPGCGKTLLAKAVAAESKANFISVKGPELFNKYVGESERAVRQVFMRARSSVPCVIFFDEVDALLAQRNEQSEASARVVNTILTELDGLSDRDGIYLIAATNRLDMIDEAMLRAGRFARLLYVGPPKPEERVKIMRALMKKTPHNLQLAEFARRDDKDGCKNFSGADLRALLHNAARHCLRNQRRELELVDFEEAAKTMVPSIRDLQRYEELRKKFESVDWLRR
ncbi:ribosome biogenesis ATPase RIX7 [Westerdykella ornata]|uniref:Ribosome biogenesis ATPase RIX7 n=1 Tax=Westerdykella ornata TaxID=318751 RepID=A0A6A6JMZ1_WESOR|nr:ribosome biogenesis ATPase RIX7 [Westerdykella ornata]KAF2277298.1 ribosome biogenesis ATPase RIX7 [Westerdykella ornata]